MQHVTLVAVGSDRFMCLERVISALDHPFYAGTAVSEKNLGKLYDMLPPMFTWSSLDYGGKDAVTQRIRELDTVGKTSLETKGTSEKVFLVLDDVDVERVKLPLSSVGIDFKAVLAQSVDTVPEWVCPTHTFGPGTHEAFPEAEHLSEGTLPTGKRKLLGHRLFWEFSERTTVE